MTALSGLTNQTSQPYTLSSKENGFKTFIHRHGLNFSPSFFKTIGERLRHVE